MAVSNFTFGGMDNVSDAASVGTPDTSKYLQDRAYTGCVDIVNCAVDGDFNLTRREGSTLVTPADVTSAWGNGTDTFCVANQAINRLIDGTLLPVGNSPTMADVTEFVQVNDITVFSDNATIGYISGGIPYVVSSPGEETDILDLETWVKLTYPAGADQAESNMEIDAFKLATFAGRCLEFYNGALYLAVDNFIFRTKTFNVESMDIRYNVVAGFSAPVTMVKAVNGGLFVGTEQATYFLKSDGTGFKQERLTPFKVIYGSAVAIPVGEKGEVGAAWLSPNGLFVGTSGGNCVNLSAEKVSIPSGTSAAALCRRYGDDWQYLASISGEGVVVNLGNGAHSRYTGFSYKGFFQIGTQSYGANADGVMLLEGETDYDGALVDAYAVTPVADFGQPQRKICSHAYLHVRTEGEMTLDLFVDEEEVATELPFTGPHQIGNGLRRLRAKLPIGVKGTNWQFKISNVDGCRFTAMSLKVVPVVTQRYI
jgi:hypothetical protein